MQLLTLKPMYLASVNRKKKFCRQIIITDAQLDTNTFNHNSGGRDGLKIFLILATHSFSTRILNSDLLRDCHQIPFLIISKFERIISIPPEIIRKP